MLTVTLHPAVAVVIVMAILALAFVRRGPRGDTGAPGRDGLTGPTGPRGLPGPTCAVHDDVAPPRDGQRRSARTKEELYGLPELQPLPPVEE